MLFAGLMLFALMLSWQGLLGAQEPPDAPAVTARFAEWNATLDRIGHEVNTSKLDSIQLETLSDQAGEIRSQAVEFAEEIETFANEARELRDAFMATTPGEAAESEQTQAQGKELAARVAQFEGWLRQANLTLARADQLLDKISSQRLAQLAKSLAERGPLPINPIVWWRAAEETMGLVAYTASTLRETAGGWLEPGSETGVTAASVAGIAIAAWFAALLALRLALRRHWPILTPTLGGPATRISLAVLQPAIPWLAAGIAGLSAAPIRDWLPLAGSRAVLMAFVAVTAVGAVNLWMLRAAIARPPAGLPSIVPDAGYRAVAIRVYTILLTLFAIDVGLQTLTAAHPAVNLIAVWTLVLTVVGCVFCRRAVTVIEHVLTQRGGDGQKMLRLGLLLVPTLVAIVSIAASVLGFAEFADYVFANTLATAAVIFAAVGLRQATQEIVVRVCDIASPAGRKLHEKLGADQPALRLAQFWLGIALDFASLLLTLIALMVVWGTGAKDAFLMLERLVEGVRVGNVTLSLADLVIAVFTFMIGVWLTRFVQRLLEQRVFPGTDLDLGVRNSLRSGLGYIGVMIAGFVAVMALGIDLSNLALVAGALSVGIGFGLQNIINNFVSGLILLIERPVKVGDWIAVGGSEGVVKRINVRSTEIITGSRASVMIPNADFLSVSVTNWTHKDKGGRLHLTFQLPAELGARGGRDLLLACAAGHPMVLSDPPPHVLLQEIGGGYTFELEADVGDATTMRQVASDLRFAVDAALNARPA